MSWNTLDSLSGIDQIVKASLNRPQLIFKHSIRCGISSRVKSSLFADETQLAEKIELHFLDLIKNRPVSNAVAEKLGIHHESPQIILIDQGEVKLDLSHYAIQSDKILEAIPNKEA